MGAFCYYCSIKLIGSGDGSVASIAAYHAIEQTADLANYIRNSWSNKAPAILPSEVQPALKAQVMGYQKY